MGFIRSNAILSRTGAFGTLFPSPAYTAVQIQFFDTRLIATLLCATVLAGGCDLPQRPPLESTKSKRSAASGPPSIDGQADGLDDMTGNRYPPPEPPGGLFKEPWETWDAYFVGNQQVGYSHLSAQPTEDRAGSDVRYELDNLLYVRQGQSRTMQRLLQTSTETSDGKLLSFDSSLQVGPVSTRYQGAVSNDVLRIETIRGRSRSTRAIDWDSVCRGFAAIEQSLRRTPLVNKGDKRTLKIVLPGHYRLGIARLRCSGEASVPLLDGVSKMIEINYEVQVDKEPPTRSTIWTDQQGKIVRTYSPGIELVTYRTDEATATKVRDQRNEVVAINVSGTIQRPSEAKRVALTIAANQEGDPGFVINPAPGQFVRKMSDGSFQVLVSRNFEKTIKAFEGLNDEPSDEDSKPNFFVDSNATLVRRFADAAIGARELSEQEIAAELAHTAQSLISDSTLPDGVVRASDVANLGVGDSTGRSILLAALLRARQIPSRVAIGLKYEPDQPNRMVYRMWTLAYADGQWIHLDATDGGQAPADRIILGTTNLSDRDQYQAFVPFLNAISRMKIEIRKTQY